MSQAGMLQNIGPKERLKRYVLGFLLLAGTTALAIYLIGNVPDRWPRAALVVPFFFAWLCIFQASGRTCVMHVAKGTCNLDQGTQPLADAALQGKLRAKALGIYAKSAFTALLWAGCAMMIGSFDLNPSPPAKVLGTRGGEPR